uniref:Putative gelatinase a n=1 Tax=Culex tarsalis TaxID=7177 RepID=A0A1Q3FP28_CULTA
MIALLLTVLQISSIQFTYGVPVYIDPDTAIKPEYLQRNSLEKDDALPLDPRPAPEVTEREAAKFLEEMGFLNHSADEIGTRLDQVEGDPRWIALVRFQKQFQLPESGKLDDDTRRLIAAPKCGVSELNVDSEKWTKPVITYKINSFPNSLEPTEARKLIGQAFGEWSKHANLDIVEVKQGDADIFVSDEAPDHQDRMGFSCRFLKNTTVAHAFFPEIGDVHYNRAKSYTPDEFLSASMHEIGHSLGLDHVMSKSSIMYPLHIRYHMEIPIEDQRALQALYGVRTTIRQSPRTTTPVPVESTPRLCSLDKIDTIVNDASGQTFALAGNYYYDLSQRNPAGRRISSKWPRLPGSIDAAFTYRGGRYTFFFKGSRVWVYADDQLEAGYPRAISSELPGLPNNLDAAYVTKAGSIVAIRRKQYWFYNPSKRPQVSGHFPRLVYDFHNMPVNLDAALHHTDRQFYFFKGREYYRLNLTNFTVGPPSAMESKWFKC